MNRLLSVYRSSLSSYKRRVRQAIRNSDEAKALLEKVSTNRLQTSSLTDELNREWSSRQRRVWNEDPSILDLRKKRRLAMNRTSKYNRHFSAWLREHVGEEPYLQLMGVLTEYESEGSSSTSHLSSSSPFSSDPPPIHVPFSPPGSPPPSSSSSPR